VKQEELHDLIELGHTTGQGAGFRKVHDLARDPVERLQAGDHGTVGEVKELRALCTVVLRLEGNEAAQEHRHAVLALVEEELQHLHGELLPGEGDEAARDGPEAGLQRLPLRGLAAVEADALREGPAARVGRAEGALPGLQLRLQAAATPAEALGQEEGRGEEARGEARGQAALPGAGPLHVQPDDAAAHEEDAGLEERAGVGLHHAPRKELEEELHEQVRVVGDALVCRVHAEVEVAECVVQVPRLAQVHGLQA